MGARIRAATLALAAGLSAAGDILAGSEVVDGRVEAFETTEGRLSFQRLVEIAARQRDRARRD